MRTGAGGGQETLLWGDLFLKSPAEVTFLKVPKGEHTLSGFTEPL